MTLLALAPGVHVLAVPFRFLGLVAIGTRMTALQLRDGSVLLHSPVPMDDAAARAVDALGPVRFIVAPNMFHHLFVADAMARWPEARLVAPAKLRRKRPDLRIDDEVESPPAEWSGEIAPVRIRGSMLGESVLLHEPSRTLLTADLVENFVTAADALTRTYLRIGGVYGKPGWHRLLRFVYRDRAAARASIAELLERDFERVVIAHGEPILDRPKDVLREALSFLDR